MNKLIINADDFGKSEEINFAIMSLMNLNLCTDTTLLVNFEASEHAAHLAIANERKKNVGIHLNLTEGFPLSDLIKKEKRFCNRDGLFHFKREQLIMYLSVSERKAIFTEISSQIKLCRNFGIPISHADSHNHIHEEPGMIFILQNIIKHENIPFLRITRNLGETSIINYLCRSLINTIYSLNNLSGSKYFGSLADLINSKKVLRTGSTIELMVHPGLIISNQIFDIYSKENLCMELPKIINNNTLMSYNQIYNKDKSF